MSGARARANHKLYLARLVLAAWRELLAHQEVPAATLNQAFAGPARNHLLEAYGWFLLEICQPPELPAHPPRGCVELPAVTAGKALPGEIREFMQLESGGWLARLLAPCDEWAPPRVPRASGTPNLVSAALTLPEADELTDWADRLESLFDRMRNSLDEY